MLDSHPELAVPPESHFALADSPRSLRRALRREPWFALWEIEAPDVDRLGCADAVRALFAAYAATRGKPRYADKTPHYVSHLPRLAARFPEARFVHVVRDGRDVALSLLEVPWGPDAIEDAALHWRRRVLEGRAAASRPTATARSATRRSSPTRGGSCARWSPGSSWTTTRPCWPTRAAR